ncbi:MAG: LysR family transcriptional regulator [Thiobacillaceae bacterium]
MPVPRFTLRQLQVFEAVARHLSLTRAAEELHLSQPGVSMQLAKLSDALGHPVVEHAGRRLRLTEQGQELLHTARDILAAIKRYELVQVTRRGLRGGRVRLSAITPAAYFLPQYMGRFNRRHPNVRLSLAVANREQVLAQLAADRADLYILGQPPEGLAVTAIPFLDNPLVVIAPASHPLNAEKAVSLERLAQEPWLMREPGSGTRQALERLFASRDLVVEPRMELGSNEAIQKAVAEGLGLAVVPACTLDLHGSGQIAPLPAEGFPILRRWYVTYPADRLLSVAARTFVNFLLEERPHDVAASR